MAATNKQTEQLIKAINNDDADTIRKLITNDPTLLSNQIEITEQNKGIPLSIAIELNSYNAAECILSMTKNNAPELRTKNAFDHAPLHLSMMFKGSYENFKKLLTSLCAKAKYSQDELNEGAECDGRTPLDLAIAFQDNDKEYKAKIKNCLELDIKTHSTKCPIWHNTYGDGNNWYDKYKTTIDILNLSREDIIKDLVKKSLDNRNAIEEVAAYQKPKFLQFILGWFSKEELKQNKINLNNVFLNILNGELKPEACDIAKILLEHGAVPTQLFLDRVNNQIEIKAEWMIRAGKIKILESLVKILDTNSKLPSSITPMFEEAKAEHITWGFSSKAEFEAYKSSMGLS